MVNEAAEVAPQIGFEDHYLQTLFGEEQGSEYRPHRVNLAIDEPVANVVYPQECSSLREDHRDRVPDRCRHTAVSLASDSPVFATRSIMQEVSVKPGGGLVVSAGAKHARYYQDVGVNSLSLGATQYFSRGSVSYRATRYDVEGQGKSTGHLASVRINDARGSGSTQLWLGSAETLIDSAFAPGSNEGRVRSIALRRVQPIAGQLGLSLGLARDWIESPTGNYQSTRPTIGIVLAH